MKRRGEMKGRRGLARRFSGSFTAAALAAAGGLLLLTACDFDVTNPGPVQDLFLDEPPAHDAIVNGMNRAFNDAFNELARRGGSSPRELFPSGNTGRIGISSFQRRGIYRFDDVNLEWSLAQNARWIADAGLERFREVLDGEFSSSENVARASLWGGYSYRFNGEHFCEAVVDGGGAQPVTVHFERAEEHFDRAMDVAQAAGNLELARAARAGRASVRVHLGNWSGAVADAQAVLQEDPDFVFRTQFDSSEEDQFNHLFHATANAPYRSYSVWSTPQEEYYEETGDPRARWDTVEGFEMGTQPIGELGPVPFIRQRKYTSRESPVRLSSAREMRLIVAEGQLRGGDWQGAVETLNTLREGLVSDHTGEPIPLWEAESEDDAWRALIRERGIELWLEGRRLGDFRRWLERENLDPGLFHPLEIPPEQGGEAVFIGSDRNLCFPVSQSEMETNDNIDLP